MLSSYCKLFLIIFRFSHLDLSSVPLFFFGNCSFTPCSKEALLKKMSTSKKGGSAGKVTNKLVYYKCVTLPCLLCVHMLIGISLVLSSGIIDYTNWSLMFCLMAQK